MIGWLTLAALSVLAPLLLAALARRQVMPLAAAAAVLAIAAGIWIGLAADVPAQKELDRQYRLALNGSLPPKDWEGLLEKSEALLHRCPECDRTRSLFADALVVQGQYARAAEHFALLRSREDLTGDDSLALRHARSLFLSALQQRQADSQADSTLEQAHRVALEALALNPVNREILELLGRLAEERGDLAGALDFLNRAFEITRARPGGDSLALVAEMGRLQRKLNPSDADYSLKIQIARPPGELPPGTRLLLTVYLEQGPRMPLAQKLTQVQSWPVRVQLGSDEALIPGFDLATARRKGDRVQLMAEVHRPGPEQPTAASLLAGDRVSLQLDRASSESPVALKPR